MNHEFHATYSLLERLSHVQQAAIDFLTGNTDNPPQEWLELGQVRDLTARRRLLAQALLVAKDYAHVGRAREAGGLLKAIEGKDKKLESYLQGQQQSLAQLGLMPQLPDVTALPAYSFALQFTFKLRKPYLSQDDAVWDIWDNPVKKEWVFGLPYVAPPGWKGALRAAMVLQLAGWAEELSDDDFAQQRFRLTRLFGDEKGEHISEDKVADLARFLDAQQGRDAARKYRELVRRYFDVKVEEDKPLPPLPHHRGRLMFYPTFFTEIGLEVINPHDRATGAGKQPIYFECVPADAAGTFTLLYVPFDLIGTDAAAEVAADLRLVAEGVRAMFTEYGFGAKTSSGFGVAAESVKDGVLTARVLDEVEDKAEILTDEPEPAPDLPRYQSAPDRLHPDFLNPAGALKSEDEYRAFVEGQEQKYKKKDSQLYAKARQWWETEGQQLAGETETPEPEPPAVEPEIIPPRWWSRNFGHFGELVEVVGEFRARSEEVTK